MKSVLVLMSTYNGELYLEEQIESILGQDYSNIKILVRDDGSIDRTVDILEKYKAMGKLDFYTGENLNVGKSFWDLVKKAPFADYYAFCDQDDVWFKNKISKSLERLEKEDQNIPLLYCSNTTLVNQDLKIIKKQKDTTGEYIDNYKRALILALAPGCTFVFNSRALNELKKYKSEIIDIHDWLAHRIIALKGKVIKSHESTMLYRQHQKNVIGATFGLKGFLRRIKRFLKNKARIRIIMLKQILLSYSFISNVEKELLIMINYNNSLKTKRMFYKHYKRFLPFKYRGFFLFSILFDRI